MSDKFVVSTNDVGEIIVTDVETGNVYHYGSMSNFLGLIRLLNEQQSIIDEQKIVINEMITDYKNLEKENEQLKEQLKLIRKDLTHIMLLLLNDEIVKQLSDYDMKVFERLSKA